MSDNSSNIYDSNDRQNTTTSTTTNDTTTTPKRGEGISPLVDLTGFQRDLLGFIPLLDEPHGLGIKAALEEEYPGTIHHGRLYPNLETLAEKGLIEKSEVNGRKNKYVLTARGRRELIAYDNWTTRCSEGLR